MQFFYDGQVRRYLAQLIRMLSGFKVRAVDGTEKVVPVLYGDLSRMAATVMRDNSENKIPSAPRISVYVSDLKLDTSRLADASYVNKIFIRERAVDPVTNKYTDTQGTNYTVERLMPTPYKLTIRADIWTTNTEQKLQVLEQILVLFNPSFEVQTTDNYVDWTSLTAIYLDNIDFSNRTIPVGTDSDIDVATIQLDTPIWLTPPGKLTRMGVIQTVISNIFSESTGTLNDDFIDNIPISTVYVTPGNYGVLVVNNSVRLVNSGESVSTETGTAIPIKYGTTTNWFTLLDQYGEFRAGSSRIYLIRSDGSEVVGTAAIDATDETLMLVNWDPDTYPTNTVIAGRGTIDAIVNPLTYNPGIVAIGIRYLILDNIGSTKNQLGPAAWKNADQSDFVASENDIIEWDGAQWNIVFSAKSILDIVYVTNLKTGVQYKWDGEYWTKSFEGEYMPGQWRLQF
jgi:hypothetical protein